MENILLKNLRNKRRLVCISHLENFCSTDSWSHVKKSEVDIPLKNRTSLKLSTGKLARFADGSCTAKLGNTTAMVAAVSKAKPSNYTSFMPLLVDYRQKAAAAGRIPTNHFRREMGPSEKEILTSRVIDRSLRPLFPKGYCCETQLTCNLLAVDGIHDPDVVSINAASAALAISDIPWNGPIGAVRLGLIDGEVILNPSRKETAISSLNLLLAATEHNRVVMMECGANNTLQQDIMKAIKVGVKETQAIIHGINELRKQVGKPKRIITTPEIYEEVFQCAQLMAETKITMVFNDHSHDKLSRERALEAISTEVMEKLRENFKDVEHGLLSDIYVSVLRNTFRNTFYETEKRPDGRSATDIRDVKCSIDNYAPLHGSATFQRGQTQVFCTVAFDSPDSCLKSDAISVLTGGIKEKNFMLHYEFPPYATKDIGHSSSIGRRELGHGALAEKSLRPVVPSDFPFTIRLTSEVLESNGSSSMASVCGGSLALMDAGVPISAPVAGVAVGLLSKQNLEKPDELADYRLLADITGFEDFAGDMDFKLAGTKKGITAFQLDVKIPGLPLSVIMDAIKCATDAKSKFLNIMRDAIAKPREEKKKNWPIITNIEIPLHKRSKFFGFGGYNIKKLTAETGVQVTSVDDKLFSLFAPNQDAMDEATEIIDTLLKEENVPELEFGSIYTAKIVEIRESGVMVSIYPTMKPALVPNSQLDQRKVHHPSALGLEVGAEVMVKYFGRDPSSGSMRLSRKVLQALSSSVAKNYVNQQSPVSDQQSSESLISSSNKEDSHNVNQPQ